jgi:methylmalonyl-CoA/ethylmalonyl-CoA epimerase
LYLRIDHIGIAVRSLDEALRNYTEGLGFRAAKIEEVPDQKTRVVMLPIGESRLELLQATDPDSPVARFIARRGEGMHHICFLVEDVAEEIAKLKAAGVRMIDDVARPGADGCLVAFVHPSGTGGVLVELSQQQVRPGAGEIR